MEETIITWNATNWVTVVVMVALGFMVLAVASQLIRNRIGSSDSAA